MLTHDFDWFRTYDRLSLSRVSSSAETGVKSTSWPPTLPHDAVLDLEDLEADLDDLEVKKGQTRRRRPSSANGCCPKFSLSTLCLPSSKNSKNQPQTIELQQSNKKINNSKRDSKKSKKSAHAR